MLSHGSNEADAMRVVGWVTLAIGLAVIAFGHGIHDWRYRAIGAIVVIAGVRLVTPWRRTHRTD